MAGYAARFIPTRSSALAAACNKLAAYDEAAMSAIGFDAVSVAAADMADAVEEMRDTYAGQLGPGAEQAFSLLIERLNMQSMAFYAMAINALDGEVKDGPR
jgi:hypothetical protein